MDEKCRHIWGKGDTFCKHWVSANGGTRRSLLLLFSYSIYWLFLSMSLAPIIHPVWWCHRRLEAGRPIRPGCREFVQCGAEGRLCGGRSVRKRGREIVEAVRIRSAYVASNYDKRRRSGRIACRRNDPAHWVRIFSCVPYCCWPRYFHHRFLYLLNAPLAMSKTPPSL